MSESERLARIESKLDSLTETLSRLVEALAEEGEAEQAVEVRTMDGETIRLPTYGGEFLSRKR